MSKKPTKEEVLAKYGPSKHCYTCQMTLPIDDFWHQKWGRLLSQCLVCHGKLHRNHTRTGARKPRRKY